MEYLGTDKQINHIIPLVSVRVGTYNHEAYISKCLDSILVQKTTFPFEILVGEDSSTDNTRSICIEYAKKHTDKIRLFLRREEEKILINGKPTGKMNNFKTRNAARGKYIALCDGDDYWMDPEKLQKQVDFLEKHPEFVLAFHDARMVDEHDNFLSAGGLTEKLKKDGTGLDLISGKWLPTLTVMFRNILPKTMPPGYFKVYNGDAFLYTLLGHHGGAKYVEDIKPAHYRKHAGGIWSALKQKEKYEQMLNTRTQLVSIVDKRYRWAVKKQIFSSSIFLSPYLNGFYLKLKQYTSSYQYFEFRPEFLKAFFEVHYMLIKKAVAKILSKMRISPKTTKHDPVTK